MEDVLTSIEIFCPIGKVSQFSSNPDNAPLWYVNIKSVKWKTPRLLAVGSQIIFEAHFLGKKLSYTYEVKELSNSKMVMKTLEGPFPMETTYEWENILESTTKMSLRNKGNPEGLFKIFKPFMSLMMKKANRKDLIKLKSILEKENL